MDILIQAPDSTDLSAIIELQARALGVTRRVEDLAEELAGEHVVCRVLKSGGHRVGFMNAWVIADTIELTEIAIESSFRNRGFGRHLVRWLIDFAETAHCTRITLEVRDGNLPARGLYESFNFQLDGVRRGYYSNGEDALLYSLEISSPGGDS